MNWLGLGLLGVAGWAVAAAQAPAGYQLNDQGNEAAARGDYAQAERLLGQALAAWRAMGPDYEAHAATTMINLGQTFCEQGRWREAEKIIEEALVLNRRALGPKHLRTLNNLNVLGNTYLLLEGPQRAEALYSEALAVERELYPNDVQLAQTLVGLSSVRERQGKLDEALSLGEEALAIALQAGGEGSPTAAIMYENVARIHRVAGRPERALPLFRKAHAVYERTFGPAHPRLASLLSEEGLALMADGNLGLAAQNMQQAVRILSDCPGWHLQLGVAESNLGLLRLRQKKYVEADAALTHAVSIEEQFPARAGSDLAATLQILAEVREKERRHAEAESLKQRANAILAYH